MLSIRFLCLIILLFKQKKIKHEQKENKNMGKGAGVGDGVHHAMAPVNAIKKDDQELSCNKDGNGYKHTLIYVNI